MVICNGRATEQFSVEFLTGLLGENYDAFPEGSEFALYENLVPVALIQKPDGGAVCLAFDSPKPRGFPGGSFLKSDHISYEEFAQRRKEKMLYGCNKENNL